MRGRYQECGLNENSKVHQLTDITHKYQPFSNIAIISAKAEMMAIGMAKSIMYSYMTILL
jgi:hypothetical protein